MFSYFRLCSGGYLGAGNTSFMQAIPVVVAMV